MSKYSLSLLLSSCLLVGCLSSVSAQQNLSLSDAIQIGLANNFQIQISEKNIQIAQNNDAWGQAGRYPSVNFALNSQNGINSFNDPSRVFQPEATLISGGMTANVDVNWTLFEGNKVKINKQQFEQLVAQSEGNAALVVETAVQNIILNYYQVQIQQEQLEVLKEVLALSNDRIAYEETRKEFGQAGTFDLLQTQDAYLNDSTNYVTQLNAVRNSMRNLNLAMGEDELDRQYTLTDPLELENNDYQLEDLQQQLFANNKNLQLLYVNRDLASINTNLQESNQSIRVALNTGLSYSVSPQDNGDFINPFTMEPLGVTVGQTMNYYLNFSLTYPLFDGGVRRRAVDNAQLQEITAQLNIDDQKRMLDNQLRNTLANYRNQVQVVNITETLLENARQNLQIAEERFKGGLINSFDYRTIQLGYINASQSQLTAIYNLKVTETELIRLIGGLVSN
jgi:outer membrane protein